MYCWMYFLSEQAVFYLCRDSPLRPGHHTIDDSPWGWVPEPPTDLGEEPGTHSLLHHDHSQLGAERKGKKQNSPGKLH